MEYSNIFPSQKKSTSEKGKAWRKECINGAENLVYYSDDTLRKSRKNKQINYNLYSDILDPNDVTKIIDPLGLESSFTPAKMQNYPIINPKIDLLVGEEIKRKFDWRVRVINDDAISSKEKQLAGDLSKIIGEFISKGDYDEEELSKVQDF